MEEIELQLRQKDDTMKDEAEKLLVVSNTSLTKRFEREMSEEDLN